MLRSSPYLRLTLVLMAMLGGGGAVVASGQRTLSLQDAIRQAQASPLANVARDQVDAARGGLRQAKARPNPRLYLQSEDLRPWADNFDFGNNTEDYGYVEQTIETAGKRSRRTAYAAAAVTMTRADQSLRLQEIALRVASAYWQALASAAVADLLERDIVVVEELVRYHQARVEAGAMRGVDLLRMQIERDRLAMALSAARRDASLSRVELFRQMGQPPDPGVKLTEAIDQTLPIPTLALTTALEQRPDMVAARAALESATAQVKLQRSFAVPDLDLFGGYKRNSGANTLYGALQIPLPFNNRNQGEIERAEAELHAAQDSLDNTALQVRADIVAAQEAFDAQRSTVQDLLPDMRDRAKRDLDIMTDAYRSGGVDLLRYIDAERTAIETEVTAVRTLAEYQQSSLRLRFAYGMQP